MKIFKQRQRIIQLEKELITAETNLSKSQVDCEQWSNRAKKLDQEFEQYKPTAEQIEKERNALRKQVKAQLESELVLTSLKIIFEMLKPEAKPESPYLSQLATQQRAMQGQLAAVNQGYGTSLWGSLGLGGLY